MRYLFIGPTLPEVDTLVDGTDVWVLPPIAAGDLLRLPLAAGDVVGIVDGYFHQTGAVRHKEILAALAAGVRVLGASSMGALRAAELHRYGMEGVGRIYADYRDGRIVGDDEVVLMHGPAEAGYPSFSVPMVNVRSTVDVAVDLGVLTRPVGNQLVAEMAASPYPQRTYRALDRQATALGVDGLGAFCREYAMDVKRSDARLLLDRLSDPDGPTAERPALSRTTYLHAWEFSARGAPGPREAWLGQVCQLFATDYPDFHRDLVFWLIGQECAAECERGGPGSPLHTAIAHGRHRGFYDRDFGFLPQWTTEAERSRLSHDESTGRFITRSYQPRSSVAIREAANDLLRAGPAFARAARIVDAAGRLEAKVRAANHDSAALPADRVVAWFAQRWQVGVADIEFAALDRGLWPFELFLGAARRYYLVGRYEPALTDLRVLADARGSGG
jgi:hypothetical protein